jgi:hypothetical protein
VLALALMDEFVGASIGTVLSVLYGTIGVIATIAAWIFGWRGMTYAIQSLAKRKSQTKEWKQEFEALIVADVGIVTLHGLLQVPLSLGGIHHAAPVATIQYDIVLQFALAVGLSMAGKYLTYCLANAGVVAAKEESNDVMLRISGVNPRTRVATFFSPKMFLVLLLLWTVVLNILVVFVDFPSDGSRTWCLIDMVISIGATFILALVIFQENIPKPMMESRSAKAMVWGGMVLSILAFVGVTFALLITVRDTGFNYSFSAAGILSMLVVLTMFYAMLTYRNKRLLKKAATGKEMGIIVIPKKNSKSSNKGVSVNDLKASMMSIYQSDFIQ